MNVVRQSDKEKYVYNCYGMRFDTAGLRSFDNDYAINVETFDGKNTLLSADNHKNTLIRAR